MPTAGQGLIEVSCEFVNAPEAAVGARILADIEMVAHLSGAPLVRGGDAALVQRIADALEVPVERVRNVQVAPHMGFSHRIPDVTWLLDHVVSLVTLVGSLMDTPSCDTL